MHYVAEHGERIPRVSVFLRTCGFFMFFWGRIMRPARESIFGQRLFSRNLPTLESTKKYEKREYDKGAA